MKKLLIMFFMVAVIAANVSADGLYIDADQTQTGWVNSYGYVNVYADGTQYNPYYVGYSYYTDYRTIFTFDTSAVPADAENLMVILWLNFTIPGYEMEYLCDNIAVDFAGSSGFGGSYAVTSLDYSAVAAASFETAALSPFGGLVLECDSDNNCDRNLSNYINRNGKTQIRLRFFQNPEYLLSTFTRFYDYDTYTYYPVRLQIFWSN